MHMSDHLRVNKQCKMFIAVITFAVLLALLIPLVPRVSAGDMNIWVAPDIFKVKCDTPNGGASYVWSPGENKVTLKGARNEYVACQLIVNSGRDLSGVTASVTDLGGPSATLTADNVRFFREWYLNVTETSTSMYGDPSSDGTGWYPDPLIPFDAPIDGAPFDVPAGQNAGIWVDLYIPTGMPAGDYTGSLTVTGGGETQVLNLDVQAYDFALPDKPSFKTWFYYGQDELANGHHVAKYDDHYIALQEKYMKMARQHRFNIDAPVYFDYSGTGTGVRIDWASYHDELASPLYDGGVYGKGGGMDPICLPINSGFPYPDDHGGLYSQEFADTFITMLRLVKQHFDEHGWSSRTFLWVLDEPNDAEAYDEVRRYGQLVRDSGTGFRLMETEQPEPQDPSWGSLVGYVNIWCAGTGAYNPATMNERRAAGDGTWAYNGGRPYAGSQLIDSGGDGMMTWPWLSYKYGVQCWLYWHCMYWKDIYNAGGSASNDVWTNPLSFDQRRGGIHWADWGNGDGTLFYPGYDKGIDGPISSVRMKSLRRGMQDYEYMTLLDGEGQGAVARAAVDSVVDYGFADAEGRPQGWTVDANAWETARESMASQIKRNDFEVKSSSYLAEGTTRPGFEEWITIQNPEDAPANVAVRYMMSDGQNRVQNLQMPPTSRTTVDVNSFLGAGKDVSAFVTSDRDVVVERPMYFNYHGAWTGGHDVMATRSPGKTWYLSEGTTRAGFEEWITVQNPNDSPANVMVRYMLATGENREQGMTLQPLSRKTIDVNAFLGPGRDCSALVTSDSDIVVERPVYFNYHGAWTGGHDVMGATAPALNWYLAEGTTRQGFEEWITLQNPGKDAAHVSLRYMLSSGENRTQDISVPPESRKTVDVNAFLGSGVDSSVMVTSDVGIIAERPMYFNYHGSWTGGHDVMGATAPGREWYLAEGTTRGGFEEWLTIENPNGEPAAATIRYMLSSGENRTQQVTLLPNSRATIDVNSFLGPEKDTSVKVTSDRDIIVERPMYFNYHGAWTGGHNVMGLNPTSL